eukprot:TRINITY_DN1510_c0_g1_i2.p2 TRINITY_DN1510_c0_g1~~TRINITY_DN1510_c0_g1_i2.p2  ORF type:complete len:408 (+),score=10.96 TRINITY_DN1510_c0_g1_i2:461-1684(+)
MNFESQIDVLINTLVNLKNINQVEQFCGLLSHKIVGLTNALDIAIGSFQIGNSGKLSTLFDSQQKQKTEQLSPESYQYHQKNCVSEANQVARTNTELYPPIDSPTLEYIQQDFLLNQLQSQSYEINNAKQEEELKTKIQSPNISHKQRDIFESPTTYYSHLSTIITFATDTNLLQLERFVLLQLQNEIIASTRINSCQFLVALKASLQATHMVKEIALPSVFKLCNVNPVLNETEITNELLNQRFNVLHVQRLYSRKDSQGRQKRLSKVYVFCMHTTSLPFEFLLYGQKLRVFSISQCGITKQYSKTNEIQIDKDQVINNDKQYKSSGTSINNLQTEPADVSNIGNNQLEDKNVCDANENQHMNDVINVFPQVSNDDDVNGLVRLLESTSKERKDKETFLGIPVLHK